MGELTLNGHPVSVQRAKFRRWTELEDLRDRFSRAADIAELSDLMVLYLSAALEFTASEIDDISWIESAEAFNDVVSVNAIIKPLPFMRYPAKDAKPVPYDYPGRMFFQYANMFAKNYGWTIDIIASMDVDEAMALLQEMMIDDAHRREWEWDLSERSTGYDEATKSPKYVPFPLPAWMTPVPPAPKTYKILKSMLPVGNVVSHRPDAKPS